MSFADDLNRFVAKTEDRTGEILDTLADLTLESWRDGSPITGAPGQPVGGPDDPHHGQLSDSFVKEKVGESSYVINTTEFYAPTIEDGIGFGGQTLTNPSHTGGYHSGKLTVAGFEALGEEAERRVAE